MSGGSGAANSAQTLPPRDLSVTLRAEHAVWSSRLGRRGAGGVVELWGHCKVCRRWFFMGKEHVPCPVCQREADMTENRGAEDRS